LIIPIRYLTRPQTSGLVDITVDVYDDINTLVSTYTLVEVGTTGIYGYNLNLANTTYQWAHLKCPTLSLQDIIRITPSELTLNDDLRYLIDAETGTWVRVGSRLTYTDAIGTVLAKYDLKDASGNLTIDPTLVAQRVWVP